MTDNTVVYKGRFDDDDILAALKRIDKRLDDLQKSGEEALKGVGDSAKVPAAKIGVIGGAAAAVTTKLLELGARGVEVLQQIATESIQTARTFESIDASLLGIFGGSEEAASQAFDFIRAESRRLGIDLTELATAFLPKTDSLDEFSSLAETAAGLSGRAVGKTTSEIIFSLREAVGGDFVSAKDIFDIGSKEVDRIKELQAEFGDLAGLVAGLDEVLERDGQSFENFADTSQTALNRVGEILTDLKAAFGEPIVDSQSEAFGQLIGFLEENRVEIEAIAGAIGDLVGLALEFASTRIFENVEDVELTAVTDLIADIGEFLALLGTFGETFSEAGRFLNIYSEFAGAVRGDIDDLSESTDDATGFLERLNEVFVDATRVAGFVRAAIVAAGSAIGAFAGNLGELVSRNISFEEFADRIVEAGVSAGLEVEREVENRIANAQGVGDTVRTRADERRTVSDDTGAAQGVLANNAAQRDAANAETEAAKAKEELAAAQEKVNDATEKFEDDKARKSAEATLKAERELLDQQIDFARQREDLARKNADRIADIFRKNAQRQADLARDLSQDQADIIRNASREREDIEQESAQSRVQIETDYRRELERIRDRFSFDAAEAIRSNDAIAFLSAQRRRDQELQEAERGRNEEVQDAAVSAEERRNQLNTSLQREIEDAKLANNRKLQDLRESLERELAENAIKQQRELEQQSIAEQRKRDDLRLSQQRRLGDLDRYFQERLQTIQRNLEKELALTEKAESEKDAIAKRRDETRKRNQRVDETRSGTNESEDEDETQTRGTGGVRAQLRHSGGGVVAGQPYTVKPNEELFIPNQSGTVVPLNRLLNGGVTGGGVTNNMNQNNQFGFSSEFMQMFTPENVARLEQLFTRWALESFDNA